MRSDKRYTNATFTKRVDHEAGARREADNFPHPALCDECGAIYVNGRWSTHGRKFDEWKRGRWQPAYTTTCPACVQADNGIAGGYLTVDGTFFAEHKEEIGRLLSNEAKRAREDNPLSRTIDRTEADGKLIVTTTTEHLAQRLGRALEKAYAGKSVYDFSHENKLVRVHWHRD
jgi:hypothetical protein